MTRAAYLAPRPIRGLVVHHINKAWSFSQVRYRAYVYLVVPTVVC